MSFKVAGIEGDLLELTLITLVQLTHLQQQVTQVYVWHQVKY